MNPNMLGVLCHSGRMLCVFQTAGVSFWTSCGSFWSSISSELHNVQGL